VHDPAATHGQYLALILFSKSFHWQSQYWICDR